MFVCLAGRGREQVRRRGMEGRMKGREGHLTGAAAAATSDLVCLPDSPHARAHPPHPPHEQALKDAKAMAARATELNPTGVLLKVGGGEINK